MRAAEGPSAVKSKPLFEWVFGLLIFHAVLKMEKSAITNVWCRLLNQRLKSTPLGSLRLRKLKKKLGLKAKLHFFPDFRALRFSWLNSFEVIPHAHIKTRE